MNARVAVAFLGLVVAGGVGLYLALNWGSDGVLSVDKNGTTVFDTDRLSSEIERLPKGTLSEDEEGGILYMREEEKLARDVYLALYDKWGISIFGNIGESEGTHMEAVKTLIDRYELTDSSTGIAGNFGNEDLQGLYDQLVAEGSKSLEDALRVGAAIEEIDILDLEEYLSQTDKEDITMVYENLLKGSRNHLRSFVSNLQKRGIEYSPRYLSENAYRDIIDAPMERGNAKSG
jgi:hypothetical protein